MILRRPENCDKKQMKQKQFFFHIKNDFFVTQIEKLKKK